MSVNNATLALIKSFEGCALQVYLDPVKIPTVGVGHVVRPEDNLQVGDTITQAQADEFLQEDLQSAETDVDNLVDDELTENQRGALVSFTFNAGAGNLRKLMKDGLEAVPARLLLFNHAGGKVLRGLTRRRQAEAKLFLTPDQEI